MKITFVTAWQIYDSRGVPTVEAGVELETGALGHGTTPSGASTGQFEALELRDGNPRRFRGKPVFQAIAKVQNEIAPALRGENVFEQAALDEKLVELDGTPNKSRLGDAQRLSRDRRRFTQAEQVFWSGGRGRFLAGVHHQRGGADGFAGGDRQRRLHVGPRCGHRFGHCRERSLRRERRPLPLQSGAARVHITRVPLFNGGLVQPLSHRFD